MAAKRPKKLVRPEFLVIDGCPVPYDVAPYVWVVLRHAGLTASSIYRGDDPAARAILNRHGKHTQSQLYYATPAQRAAMGVTGTPNRPGGSMHELRSDAVAKKGPWGRLLETWEIGVDAGPNTDDNRRKLRASAAHFGLSIYFPYNSVVEYHHFGFSRKPTTSKKLSKLRVMSVRARLRLVR